MSAAYSRRSKPKLSLNWRIRSSVPPSKRPPHRRMGLHLLLYALARGQDRDVKRIADGEQMVVVRDQHGPREVGERRKLAIVRVFYRVEGVGVCLAPVLRPRREKVLEQRPVKRGDLLDDLARLVAGRLVPHESQPP